MKLKCANSILFLFFYATYFAQYIDDYHYNLDTISHNIEDYCGLDVLESVIDSVRLEAIESAYIENALSQSFNKINTDYTLPVVVHIIHNNGLENISDSAVQLGIEQLNHAFANTGYFEASVGVPTPFQFCLAKENPEGNATSGINRIVSDFTEVTAETEDEQLKSLIQWDPESYINIWLVKEICSTNAGCNVAGYALLPDAHGTEVDGIVVEARRIGTDSEADAVVLVHEMGHYLGLRHTFLGGCVNNDCLSDGDRVCDTPPDQSTASVPCDSPTNTCSTDVNLSDPNNPFTTDENDHIWNYMDYGDWGCQFAFTEGQSDRMEFFLNEVRYSLLNSIVCEDPCPDPIYSMFTASEINISIGEQVMFTNLSENATDYIWYINEEQFSTSIDPVFTFLEEGIFEISLEASNDDFLCLEDKYSLTINVSCTISATISASATNINEGETIDFSSFINDANAFVWFINGDSISLLNNLSYEFTEVGYYEVYGIARNSFCKYRSNSILVKVSSPCKVADEAFSYKYYEGSESFRGSTKTNDGGCIISGRDRVVKKDSLLNDEWMTVLDSEGVFRCFHITELENNEGYICTGQYDLGQKPFIIMLDIEGEILWERFISNYVITNLSKVVELPNGNLILIGSTITTSPGTFFSGFILKFDKQGNILWNKFYTGMDSDFIYFYDFQIEPDGSMMIICGVREDSEHSIPTIVKLSEEGEIYWSKKLDINCGNSAYPNPLIILKNDGTYILSINVVLENNQVLNCLLNVDGNGELLNNKTFNHAIYQLTLTDDEDLLGTGNSGYFKISQDFEYLWGRRLDELFGLSGGIQELSDETLIVVGDTGGPWQTEAGYIRTDKNGFLSDCSVELISVEEANCDVTMTDISLVETEGSLSYETIDYEYYQDTIPEMIMCPVIEYPEDLSIENFGSTTCTDSVTIQLQICNSGYSPSSAEVPITFYNNDPTTAAASVISTLPINESIETDTCATLALKLANDFNTNSLFAIVNDNGSLGESFSLDDFPTTAFSECDYYNNIALAENENIDFLELNLGIDTVLCPESSMLISAGDFDDYIWNTGDTLPQIEINIPGNYWVETNNFCGSYHDTISVLPYSPLTLELGADLFICENDIQVLNAGTGYTSYLWNDSSEEQFLTASSPGDYWVQVTDECGINQLDTISIYVDSTSILELGPDTIICPNDTLAISVSGFESYQWTPSQGINCDTCANVVITPEETTVYTLVATHALGCLSTDNLGIELLNLEVCDSTSVVKENLQNITFEIYPNPNSGLSIININLNQVTHFELKIFDAVGRLIEHTTYRGALLDQTLDWQNLSSGVYFIQLVTPELELTRKVLVL